MDGTKEQIILGYWNIRGRAQVPRLLLAYTGAIWKEVQYANPQQWFEQDKYNLQLDFPNLPYLIQGDLRITQTDAIVTYIIERSNRRELLGRDIKERAKILNLVGVILQCLQKMLSIAFSPNGSSFSLTIWNETICPKLQYLTKFKGNKTWLMENLTLADFVFVQMGYYLQNIFKQNFKIFSIVQELQGSFQNIPQIKKYYQLPIAIKVPFLGQAMAFIKF